MDVWTYFEQKLKEIEDCSLVPEDDASAMFAETSGSNGRRGRMLAHLWLDERAYIAASEVVVVRGKQIHREEYAYFLVIDGEEVWGYERDLSHDPPVHAHTSANHTRIQARAIPFKRMAELAWQELSRRAALGETEEG